MADKLTPQQAQAVQDRGGKLLVSAAAGSGKTKVLVDRLLRYLTDQRDSANLDDFLIITYTKAAASELRSKIAARLTERISLEPENLHLQKQMQRLYMTKISTIHGLCSDLIREYAYRLEVPVDFRVADETECAEIREAALEQVLTEAYENTENKADFLSFVDSQGLGRDDSKIPELIGRVYDNARCHLNPDGWLEECLKQSCLNPGEDISHTPWGRFLIDDLHDYLDCQIEVMTKCAEALERSAGMEKPAANLRDTLVQLIHLREADSWNDICRGKNIEYNRLTFPRKNPDPTLAQRVKAARDACKKGIAKRTRNFSEDSAQVAADLAACCVGVRGLIALVRQFERQYGAAKRSRRVLDFSDLEQKTLDLLLGKSRSGPTAAAAEISRRFREVMVDEYQDSNGVQDAIFSALTNARQNCFLVGDVKQSIYQFRLADPGIFLKKYHNFVPCEQANPGEGRKVLLSHNFRSGPEIVEAVNAVFSRCMRPKVGGLWYTEEEQLREGVPHAPLESPGVELHVLKTNEDVYTEEADYVAGRILQMLREGQTVRENGVLRPLVPEDIVILLRSPGSTAAYFQRALEKAGICCVSGSGLDLFQTQEIDTFRSFLITIQNPRQDIPLVSTLASPVFGFTSDDLARIRAKQVKGSFYDALASSDDPKATAFVKILTALRQAARMNTLTELLEKCISLTHLDSVYAAMPGGTAKSANIQSFFQMASDYENGGLRDLSQFLGYLDALEGKGIAAAKTSSQGAVSIMSIHKSKGLEFPVVFLCNLSRKFNTDSLTGQILCDRDLGIGLSVADPINRLRYPSVSKRAIAAKMETESISEEMRVLYVAMTRARDRLIMTYASKSVVSDLQDTALRMDFDGGELLCRDASCPGDWVLLTALGRTEAGELQAIGDKPVETTVSAFPWKICFPECDNKLPDSSNTDTAVETMPEGAEAYLNRALTFRYAHDAATLAPSKQTATDRKGREKDEESTQDTQESQTVRRVWRRPSFRDGGKDAAAYGSAVHLALQYIRFENCGSLHSVEQEMERLYREGFLTQEQTAMVNCKMISEFFETQIGKKLLSGTPCLREFKFSILEEGNRYGAGLEGEQVLLQGVVDCALLEEDGITVIDFKTDHVTEKTLENVICRYRLQVETYADALSRIYEKPVKEKLLYFFRLGSFAQI